MEILNLPLWLWIALIAVFAVVNIFLLARIKKLDSNVFYIILLLIIALLWIAALLLSLISNVTASPLSMIVPY